jgi:hypothetical protein
MAAMKGVLASKAVFPSLIAVAALASGCAQHAPTFSWHHPMGGEYLFAYDKNECEGAVTAQGLALGSDTEGPFFQCMEERGYFLVTANGVLRAPTETVANAQAGIPE